MTTSIPTFPPEKLPSKRSGLLGLRTWNYFRGNAGSLIVAPVYLQVSQVVLV